MTAQTKDTLKTYFITGAKPTQAQFANLIDSYLNIIETSAQTVAGPVNFTSTVSANVTSTGSTTSRSLAKRFQQTFDIRDYGAVCDGVTNDTTAIQAAVTAAQNAGGGRVIISGYSKITSTITITASGVEVVGLDRINCGILCSSTAVTAFKIGGTASSVFRCRVANMKISTCNIGVWVSYNTAQNYVEDLYVTGGVQAVVVQGDYTTNPIKDSINTYINRVEAEGMSGNIFYFYMCGEVYFDGLQTPSPLATAYGIVVDSGTTAVYGAHANCTGCKGGLLIADLAGISPNPTGLPSRPRQSYFYQVQGDTCIDFGIQLQRGYQINFLDCWASGTTAGAGFVLGDSTNNISQIGLFACRALGNNQDGIRLVQNASNMNAQIEGCHVLSNGTAGAGTYDGIMIQDGVSGVIITGNNIFNDTSQGLNNTQRYGVNFASGTNINNVCVSDNNFASAQGNLTLGVNYGTTGTGNIIKNNLGVPDFNIWRTIAQSSIQTLVSGNASIARTTVVSANVSANTLGRNGRLKITFIGGATGTNTKSWWVKAGTTDYTQINATTQLSVWNQVEVNNRNATNSQVGHGSAQTNWSTNNNAVITSTEDTTAVLPIKLDIQTTVSAESVSIESYVIEAMYIP